MWSLDGAVGRARRRSGRAEAVGWLVEARGRIRVAREASREERWASCSASRCEEGAVWRGPLRCLALARSARDSFLSASLARGFCRVQGRAGQGAGGAA